MLGQIDVNNLSADANELKIKFQSTVLASRMLWRREIVGGTETAEMRALAKNPPEDLPNQEKNQY